MTEYPAPDTAPGPVPGTPAPVDGTEAADAAGVDQPDTAGTEDAAGTSGPGSGTDGPDSADTVDAADTAGADGPDSAGTGALLDATRRRLAELDGAPVASHVAVYDEVHGALQGALASLDEG